MSGLVIAIDGPAGAGKSTVARGLAARLGLRYLDTGAMYRAVALKAEGLGLGVEDAAALARVAADAHIRFDGPVGAQRVFLDGADVTEAVRRQEIGEMASAISVHTPVRREMVRKQQKLIVGGGWTLEGRDTTTVVAPNADLKVYLDASLEVRAGRRLRDLRAQGVETDLVTVMEQIRQRDERDSSRGDSPLSVAPGAVVIHTDDMTADEVVARIAELAGRC